MNDWRGWTPLQRVRIWLAGVVLGPKIWRMMCDSGWCPRGIHIRTEDWRARFTEVGKGQP